ncbi:MAG: hypothetical protein M3384_13530 [Acidobacteriota bacterium]|nr:hypothetical protein [Acidobacteriota bacterium]
MKFKISQKIIAFSFVAAFALLLFSCGGQAEQKIGGAQTPTEAYKMLFAAVKSKDTEKIKKMMSKDTMIFAQAAAQQQNKSLENMLENGFYASTFSTTLPRMRDERVKDNFGAVEVWNEKERVWEDVAFIKEEDGWKIAIGDIFKGTYQMPGKPQSIREREDVNTMNPNTAVMPGNINTNVNMNTIPMTNVKTPPLANKDDGAKKK